MDSMQIETAGRTLTCSTAPSPATPGTLWWWLQATGESQRYAAFRTDATDTVENVRLRLAAYYDKLLADRARPREVRAPWGRRAAVQPPEAPATPETVTPTSST